VDLAVARRALAELRRVALPARLGFGRITATLHHRVTALQQIR
jgi:hypothetical protein